MASSTPLRGNSDLFKFRLQAFLRRSQQPQTKLPAAGFMEGKRGRSAAPQQRARDAKGSFDDSHSAVSVVEPCCSSCRAVLKGCAAGVRRLGDEGPSMEICRELDGVPCGVEAILRRDKRGYVVRFNGWADCARDDFTLRRWQLVADMGRQAFEEMLLAAVADEQSDAVVDDLLAAMRGEDV
eukprot:PLAT168.1.p2 GENE.PLAT168.1~~PLAT168.1.p2  ORF type:complete len:182 (+),score=12.05 PLAT168.1:610-1155(+)